MGPYLVDRFGARLERLRPFDTAALPGDAEEEENLGHAGGSGQRSGTHAAASTSGSSGVAPTPSALQRLRSLLDRLAAAVLHKLQPVMGVLWRFLPGIRDLLGEPAGARARPRFDSPVPSKRRARPTRCSPAASGLAILDSSSSCSACAGAVLRAHLALFYVNGWYFHWAKRLTGTRYSFIGRILEPRPHYRVLGWMILAQLGISGGERLSGAAEKGASLGPLPTGRFCNPPHCRHLCSRHDCPVAAAEARGRPVKGSRDRFRATGQAPGSAGRRRAAGCPGTGREAQQLPAVPFLQAGPHEHAVRPYVLLVCTEHGQPEGKCVGSCDPKPTPSHLRRCITEWSLQKTECPICRTPFRTSDLVCIWAAVV